MRGTKILARAIAAACIAAGLGLPGCNIVAPAYLLVHGPEKMPAQFELPSERPTVVLVDVDSASPVRPAVRAALAEQIGRDLMEYGGLKSVVDPRSAQSIASLDRFTSQMPTSEIGRSVGAEVVVHVMLGSLRLSPDGQTYAPSAVMHVKVIDATQEQRLFPEEREGQPVTVSPRTSVRVLPERGTEWTQAELEFARYAGTAVAQMFYEHERGGSHLLGR